MSSGKSIYDWEPVARAVRGAQASGDFLLSQPAVVARAPGRLDVMGGIADYSGSRVCEMPLHVAAAVVAQRRTDGKILCRSAQESQIVTLDARTLDHDDPRQVRELLTGPCAWARYIVGTWWWLLRKSGPQPRPATGVTLYVDSDVPLGGGVSSSAAIEVAALTAGAAVLGVTIPPLVLATAGQYVENHIVGAPCGVMDQVTSCLGRDGAMLEILCQPGTDGLPAQVLGAVHVPEGYAFIGIHSGVRHEVSGDPYTDARVAAFMGQKILSTLEKDDLTRGWLARVDARAYLHQWRNRLPEKMTGREFLERYGRTHDPVTTVKPETTYAVRAGTDHHVFEMERVTRFVALLKGAAPGTLAQRVRQAGELMYDSHDSYGQNAGLGHPLTDRLVKMVRQLGPEHGFYGAKITGGGSGGTVAIFLRHDAATLDRAQQLRREYEKQTGRSTLFFHGTSPGAAELGAAQVSWQTP